MNAPNTKRHAYTKRIKENQKKSLTVHSIKLSLHNDLFKYEEQWLIVTSKESWFSTVSNAAQQNAQQLCFYAVIHTSIKDINK